MSYPLTHKKNQGPPTHGYEFPQKRAKKMEGWVVKLSFLESNNTKAIKIDEVSDLIFLIKIAKPSNIPI